MNARDLQLYFLPGKYIETNDFSSLYEQAYFLWKKIWSDEFIQAHSIQSLNADSFLRQDCIQAVTDKNNNILALFLMTFYNIDYSCVKDSSYFKSFAMSSIEDLLSNNIKQIMTLEYLTVCKEARAGKTGVHFAELVLALGLEFFKTSSADAAIGVARKDYRMNKMAKSFGATEVSDMVKCNVPCEVVLFKRENVKEHWDPLTKSLVSQLWQSKIDLRSVLPRDTPIKHKKAA